MAEPARILAVGYGAAAVVVIDQVTHLGAVALIDSTPLVVRFQMATVAAPRLLPMVVATLLVLILGTWRRDRWALRIATALGVVVVLASILTGWVVLWDGAEYLTAFGPPGGRLDLFQGQRLRSLIGAALALLALGAGVPAAVLARGSVDRVASR